MAKFQFKNAWEADRKLPPIKAGEVYSYARVSRVDAHRPLTDDGVTTSIADQHTVNDQTAERFGLPPIGKNRLADEGLSGSLWWDGVDLAIGLEEDGTRPAFTILRNKILSGECRALVVYSHCRLGRGVGIIEAFLLTLCRDMGVRVYDPSGLMDIWSADARSYIRFVASANARHREKSTTDSRRGIEERFNNGDLVMVAGCMGFRSGGFRSRRAVPVESELEVVRWVFKAFADGVDERGPLSIAAIAEELTRKGVEWAPDLASKRGGVFTALKRVPQRVLRKALSDVRYQGRQHGLGTVGDCPTFLVDGKPAIDPDLWNRAQRRREAIGTRPPARNRTLRPFSGLVRCGVDGEATLARWGAKRSDGTQPVSWGRYAPGGLHSCRHVFPRIEAEVLAEYYKTTLSPILMGELEVRASADSVAALLEKKEGLQAETVAVKDWLEQEFPAYAEHVSAAAAGRMEGRKTARLEEIHEELLRIDEALQKEGGMRHDLQRLDELPSALLVDLIAHTVRWVAVLPIGGAVEGDGRNSPRNYSGPVGRLLFLMHGGIYHSAVVEQRVAASGQYTQFIRTADVDEMIGTIRNLPNPPAFISQLRRAASTAAKEFDPEGVAPGALPEHFEQAADLFPEPPHARAFGKLAA